MADRIQLRRDTKANWESYNPILLEGEPGHVLDDPNLYKMGDGVHAWNDLPYRGYNGTVLQEVKVGVDNSVPSSNAIAEEFILTNLSTLALQNRSIKIDCVHDGYYSNGTLYGVEGASYCHTDLIKAVSGKFIMVSNGSSTVDKIGFYNSNKEYIGRYANNIEDGTSFKVEIPENVAYVRFTTKKADGCVYFSVIYGSIKNIKNVAIHNKFDYADVLVNCAIDPSNGNVRTVGSNSYKAVKFYLEAGKYLIVSPNSGSQDTLWKYTDSSYSTTGATRIIGNHEGKILKKVIDLEAGYYAFGWNDYGAADDNIYGAAFITNSWPLYDDLDEYPTFGSDSGAKSNGVAEEILLTQLGNLNLDKKSVDVICTNQGYYFEGVYRSSENYRYTDLIKTTPGKKYSLTAAGSSTVDKIGFYNSNKEYIGRYNYESGNSSKIDIEIPSNAVYMRLCAGIVSGISKVTFLPYRYNEKDFSIVTEHNMFSYEDIMVAKAIKDTGEIWNVSSSYKLVKLYLKSGRYWIVSPGNGSQQTLWKYTDDTYSQVGAVPIIGHIEEGTPISKIVDLEDGYYAFGYSGKTDNENNHVLGVAFITDSWVAGYYINEAINKNVEIVLPDKIYSVVGDTLQLFYDGIIKAVNPQNYDILVTCDKGKQYPRYYELTPIVSDIGNATFKIDVKDNNGLVINSKECTLVTHAAPVSPASQVNVVCFGDSLTRYGIWCKELQRRLSGTGGTPAGSQLTNINLVGRMFEDNTGWFGVGGWSWNNYLTNQVGYKFFVSGVTMVHVGDYYSNNGVTFRLVEVNITNGSGYISGVSANGNAPASSGTLTFVEGTSDGDRTINFSSSESDPANPFWDDVNNKISFIPYANKYCGGKIDVLVSLLSWNDMNNNVYTQAESKIKQLADVFHAEFPNGKWKLCGIPMPSLNGGTGENYGAGGKDSMADRYYLIRSVLERNKRYQSLCNEDGYSDFMEFIDISAEFDALYNMPSREKNVNIRNSSIKEKIGANGVHPSGSGYYQIADTIYRNLVSNYC